MKGYVHSYQSLGTVDGPGVRFVVFFQGCSLRCHCCHNPDTWNMLDGKLTDVEEILDRAERCRSYFGKDGGITVSGGEPLLQPRFLRDVFYRCRQAGIHTCLDTAGVTLTDDVKSALEMTDRVLLDVKFNTEEEYERFTGGSLATTLEFLKYLQQIHIPVTVRRVIIPTVNDTSEHIDTLMGLLAPYDCVDGVELLPFNKLCQSKYDQLSMNFPFRYLPEADVLAVRNLAEPYDLIKKI